MPLYEYHCRDCDIEFEHVSTINERDDRTPQCPRCKGMNVQQVPATFFAQTSKKS
jgi:putative FmdB family regulatory protein